MTEQPADDLVLQVMGYHQATKHHFYRYARALGRMRSRSEFRRALAGNRIIIAPGVWDAMSALLCQEAGLDARVMPFTVIRAAHILLHPPDGWRPACARRPAAPTVPRAQQE